MRTALGRPSPWLRVPRFGARIVPPDPPPHSRRGGGPTLGILLAAGVGSRTGYLASLLPKTLVPVSGRPLLWHALATLRRLGVKQGRILLRLQPELVRAYLRALDPIRNLGFDSLSVRVQRTPPRGPIDSLLAVLPKRPRDFALVLGDDLTLARDVQWLSRIFQHAGADAAQLCVADYHRDAIERACEIIPGPRNRIQRILEKPPRPRGHLRGCGVYLFRGRAFPELVERGRKERRLESLTDLVALAADRGRAVYYESRGPNVNVNTIGDVLAAWALTSWGGSEFL